MEENELYDRIGETDLNPTYKDGQVYQHTDINNQNSLIKKGINENYYDIQKLQKGEKTVGNAKKLDGATLSRYIDEELQSDDNKIPSSQQAKAYMDALFSGYSAPVRGVDYWTEADQQQIVSDTANSVIEEITPDLEEALAAKANINDIPTKISDLQNDSDFLSENNLQMVNTIDIQSPSQITDATGYGRLNNIYGDALQNGIPALNNQVPVEVVTGDVNITISNSDSTVSRNYLVSLGNIELCKKDDYKDYIYYENGKWYLHKEINKIVFNGSETWVRQTASNSEYRFYTTMTDILISLYPIVGSDYFALATGDTNRSYGIGGSSNAKRIYIRNNQFTEITDLTSWLSANNTTVYYVRETAINTEITDIELLSQLEALRKLELFEDETNIIITSDNLVPKINITYAITNRDIYSKEEVNDLLDNLKKETKTFYFNSISEMKETSLKVNSIAITTGYYNSNDGGGATYKIVKNNLLTDDGGSVIELNNGYKAVLIVENDTINVKQFGAYGDNTHDDTIAIQNALRFRENNYLKIIFNENETYLMQGYIELYSNTDINLNNSTIKDCYTGDSIGHHNGLCFRSALANVGVTGYGATKNINIKDGTLDGGVSGLMFALLHGENIEFNNIYFYNCFVGTHIIDLGGCKNIRIKNSKFYGNMITDSSSAYREMIQPDYARYSSANYWGEDTSIIGYDDLPTECLIVENCSFKKGEGLYYPNAIGTHATGALPHKDIVVKDCNFYDCNTACIRIPKVVNLLVENNNFYTEFTGSRSDTYAINLIALTESTYNISSDNINIINNRFYLDLQNSKLIGIGIKGVSNFSYSINNINIRDNYFKGNYDSVDTTVGNDAIHLANIKNITIDNNKFDKMKNSVFKTSGRYIDKMSLLNNIMNFCRDFTRGGDTSTNEKLQTTNVFESNNIWTDVNGTINLNDFKVIVTLDENSTINENSRIVWGQSDSNFIYVNPDAKHGIVIPKQFHRYKITTVVYVKPNAEGTKELHGWISYANDSYNLIPNQQYLKDNLSQFLVLPKYEFKRESLISSNATLVISTTVTNSDTLNKTHYGDYLGTCVIIEGY